MRHVNSVKQCQTVSNSVNSVSSVNSVNSYSAVLPPSLMVFLVLKKCTFAKGGCFQTTKWGGMELAGRAPKFRVEGMVFWAKNLHMIHTKVKWGHQTRRFLGNL